MFGQYSMKHHFSLTVLVMTLVSCATPKPEHQQPQPTVPPLPHLAGPSSEKIAEAVAFVREGLPFPVEIDPFGAIFDSPLSGSELERLKSKFLQPLGTSPHAGKIEKVSIDASSLEWFQWTCRIELKDYMNPISITHFAGLYDGTSNDDPDAYRASRLYVLTQLNSIAKRVGW